MVNAGGDSWRRIASNWARKAGEESIVTRALAGSSVPPCSALTAMLNGSTLGFTDQPRLISGKQDLRRRAFPHPRGPAGCLPGALQETKLEVRSCGSPWKPPNHWLRRPPFRSLAWPLRGLLSTQFRAPPTDVRSGQALVLYPVTDAGSRLSLRRRHPWRG